MQKVSELEQTKKIIDARLEVLDQKYNTAEKIQKIELNVAEKIQNIELKVESKTDKDYVNMHVYGITEMVSKLDAKLDALKIQREELDSRIKSLNDEMKAHKAHHPLYTSQL